MAPRSSLLLAACVACAPPSEVGLVSGPHDVTATVRAGGVAVGHPRGSGTALIVELAGWGRGDSLVDPGPPAVSVARCIAQDLECIPRFELGRPGIAEWWESSADGIEQGFTIDRLPPGSGLLNLDLRVSGAEVEVQPDMRSARLGDLSYSGLFAFDAAGRALPARMEPRPGGLGLAVDVRGAQLPITIDPIFSGVWSQSGEEAGDFFGGSVASAGDVDGDGYSDVIVGAWFASHGESNEGRAYLFLGSATGPAATPAWTAEGDQADAYLGLSVAPAGDVNGDGYGDVAVGAAYYDTVDLDSGQVTVYHGSAVGLDAVPAWTGTGSRDNEFFGTSVASAGDVDGDGFDDLVIGAPGFGTSRPGGGGGGRAYVYLGSGSGISPSPPAILYSPVAAALYFGISVAGAGDVNADGYAEVLVGEWGQLGDPGQAFVYLGAAGGVPTTPSQVLDGVTDYDYFGGSVAGAGDIDADGYDDVVIGALLGGGSEGLVYTFRGGPTGLDSVATDVLDQNAPWSYFGYSVAGVGDVNGDGYDDVATGAYRYGLLDQGRASVYLGSASGLRPTPSWDQYPGGGSLGYSVAGAGDVNGDGLADIVVGAPYAESGLVDQGMAYVYFGSCADPIDTDADGVGDLCDACPGFDDALDADLDLVPDDCDACPNEPNHYDIDGDTVADSCDLCPDDFDPAQFDSDADGVGNACDACALFDDAIDADGDLAPDLCDLCPGFDDTLDEDGDAIADGCDACPDSDSDGDGDGVQDECDVCPQVADPAQDDTDLDQRGDACDTCPGFDDTADQDRDRLPDGCDNCPETDNLAQEDADQDLVGDACDVCVGFDDRLDTDLDLVPDACDLCALGDDALDADLDAQPDACDLCPTIANGPDLDGDGFATCSGDCWEGNPSVYLGAIETADGIDEDCDGLVDDGTVWFDDDGDGVTETGGDCDDTNAVIHLGAAEACNGWDEDCDGLIDENTECSDDDADGFSELDGDCADQDPLVFPGALELLDNRIDDDCDGVVDPGHWDPDGDGVEFDDCEPGDTEVFPGNPELENGVDDDCDGTIDEGTPSFDDDGDGFSEVQGDCDDSAADVFPGATETADRRDQDCNALIDEGTVNFDDDGDGQAEIAGDCDDTHAGVHPGAGEVANGIDDDCDDLVDEGTSDVDADGWTLDQGDCDDTTGWMNPEQVEICDGLDNDCDGVVDDDCAPDRKAAPDTEPGRSGCDTARLGNVASVWGFAWLLVGLRSGRARCQCAA